MEIKYSGIQLDKNQAINDYYKTYQDRKLVKICKETNFETGYISYEDGVFLPDGTYVLIKENEKKDVLGKIFHCRDTFAVDSILADKTAIVNVFYDMNSSKEILDLDRNLVITFIHKNVLICRHNKDKYLQVVSYEETENDKWKFVKVEYGNPGTKMFYMYGWQYYDKTIYEKKDIKSNKLSCFNKVNNVIRVYNEEYDNIKQTNVEYKIKPTVLFVPDELEYFIIYIFLMCIATIFKGNWILWIILTILFFNIRKNLRDKYNG